MIWVLIEKKNHVQPEANPDHNCFLSTPLMWPGTGRSDGQPVTGAMSEPAFLLVPPITQMEQQKQCNVPRGRIWMTSDKSTKPTNGTPARTSRQEPSVPTRKDTGTVVSMAVADEWNTDAVHQRFLRDRGRARSKVSRYGSMLYISIAGVDAFAFPFGCLVIWNGDNDDEEFYRTTVASGSQGFRQTPVVSRTRWVSGNSNAIGSDIKVESGMSGLNSVMERLAISYALAQGVKLRASNVFLRDAVKYTQQFSEELAETGYVSASKKEISKLSGKLFMERSRCSLGEEVLEIPEFLLENERYLPYYLRMKRHLEMRERSQTLTDRFEALQQFYQLLSDEITHHYSIGLELAITIMIAFEIFLSLMALARQSLRSVFSVCALFSGISLILWGLWRIRRRRAAKSAIQKFGRSSRSWG